MASMCTAYYFATIFVCECRHYTANVCTSLYLTTINFCAGGICSSCSHLTWTFEYAKKFCTSFWHCLFSYLFQKSFWE